MTLNNILTYIKKNLLGITIACAVISFIYETLFTKPADLTITLIFGVLISIITGYERYNDRIQSDSKLQKKGLTKEDVQNIKFVKYWEDIHQQGIWRYCLFNGGVITGMALFFPICIVLYRFGYKFFTFSDFSLMMRFILESIVIGFILGAIIHKIRWPINEQKFSRLTDPIQ